MRRLFHEAAQKKHLQKRGTAIEYRHVWVKPLHNRLPAFMGRNSATPVDDAVEACHENRYEAGDGPQHECWRNRVIDDLRKLCD
jgi:hypothetical protein